MNNAPSDADCPQFIESEWKTGLSGYDPKIANFSRTLGCAAAAAFHLESHLILPGRFWECVEEGEAWSVFEDLLVNLPQRFAAELVKIAKSISGTAERLILTIADMLKSVRAYQNRFSSFASYFATLLIGCNLIRQEINSTASAIESSKDCSVVFIDDNFADGFPLKWAQQAAPNLGRIFNCPLAEACDAFVGLLNAEGDPYT